MNLKIHAKGSSFKGLVTYLMHDAGYAKTSERVAWTHTMNLATDDPQLAWKLMAATALDAPRLKAKAGVKATGRKSNKAVLHVTLSWHPDEKKDLLPEEMMRAARFAVRELGADDRQVLVVCHADKKQPHVHLVINRVSDRDGRLLSNSFERLKLSALGERYERERGTIYCPQRVINNAARKRGAFTRGEKDIPRATFEQIRANDNQVPRDEVKKIWIRHRGRDRELGAVQRARRTAQDAAWAVLERRRLNERADVLGRLGERLYRDERDVRCRYEPRWQERHRERENAIAEFERNEGTVLGRLRNRAASIDLKAIVAGGERRRAISEAFRVLGSKGVRLEALVAAQDRLDRDLDRRERREIRDARRAARSEASAELDRLAGQCQTERVSLLFRQTMEQAKMRAEWTARGVQRREEIRQSMGADGDKARIDLVKEQLRAARDRNRGRRPRQDR